MATVLLAQGFYVGQQGFLLGMPDELGFGEDLSGFGGGLFWELGYYVSVFESYHYICDFNVFGFIVYFGLLLISKSISKVEILNKNNLDGDQ